MEDSNQAKGGERCEPFTFLLFSIGIQGALVGICALSLTTTVWCANQKECDASATGWRKHCPRWLASHCTERITRAWNAIGHCPDDSADLEPEVRNIDGIKVLETLLGVTEFVSSIMEQRTEVVGEPTNGP